MSAKPPVDSPTVQAHKRQLAWQIILPVALVAGLGIVAGVFTVRAGSGEARLWADVALIGLIVPLLLLGLTLTILLGFMIYGLARLTRVTPDFTGPAQKLADRLATGVKKFADTAVRPIVWINQAVAAVERFVSAAFPDKEE
jgi:hypothetical protein